MPGTVPPEGHSASLSVSDRGARLAPAGAVQPLTDPAGWDEGLSIVIPAWNEEDRLAQTLGRYVPVLRSRGHPFEVIVVVDGSADRTADVAEAYTDRGVRLLRFPTKLGKGGAVLAGLREARYPYIGYLDADGPISPQQMYGLVENLREVDCVVASRWIRGATGVRTEPLFNRVAGRFWNLLTRTLLFLPISDTQCGAKFFRASVILPLLRCIYLTNRAFDVTILYHLRRAGAVLREVPVDWRHDPASRMPIARAIPIMFLSILGVYLVNSPIGPILPQSVVLWFMTEFGRV